MSVKYHCDICKGFIKEEHYKHFVSKNVLGGYSVEHLCDGCFKEIFRFIQRLKESKRK